MDVIFIEEFRIDTLVGVYEWERKVPQTIQFDIQIGIPGPDAAQSDDLDDTIDYGEVVARIRDSLSVNHFLLLERLAEHVADIILHEFRAPWCKVSVAKLNLIRGVARLGVRIERSSGRTT
jgi:dihydroneopterin aldolase